MSLLDSDGWPHAVTLNRTVIGVDEHGGSTLSNPTAYSTDTPAWVQPASDAEILEFAKKDQRVTHAVLLESNPGVNLNDQVVVKAVADGAAFNGDILAVKSYGNADVGLGILFQMMCEIYREQPAP